MQKEKFTKINSHNEWDTLKEVIVGSAQGTRGSLSWQNDKPMKKEHLEKAISLAQKASPKWFVDEVCEDLDNLSKILEGLGSVVHRPEVFDLSKIYSSPFWSSTSNNIYNTRDLNLVVGNSIIESPSYKVDRYFETTALYPIFYKYLDKGFKWIAAPKPKLNYNVLSPYYRDEEERELTEEDTKFSKLTKGRIEKFHKLSENEILFEAANTLRMGKDLLYLASVSGNLKGAKWLLSVLGNEYKVHITKDIYKSAHIDSTVFCLRPGLVLLNSARVNERNCPPIFKKWDKIYFSDVAPVTESELKFQKECRDPISKEITSLGFNTNLGDMASPWVGMNFLSFDQETILVDERQINLIKLLEQHNFKIVPVKLRHMYTQGGGIHCATLDTVRNSKLENYFG